MRVYLAGAGGQVGRALLAAAPDDVEVTAADHARLDITHAAAVDAAVAAARPDLVVNAAAYTAVDRAESDTERAFAVNRDGAANLARASRRHGARYLHLSTDFVFDGRRSTPYPEDAAAAPLNAYGLTKLAGEAAVAREAPDALIVRTSWIYADDGRNFVRTMLGLMAAGRTVRVVDDQIGTPTHAASLARGLWALAALDVGGVVHLTDAGVASWYDVAVAIADIAHARGLLRSPPTIVPIASKDFPTPARRPAFSVLDKSHARGLLGASPPHWREELARMLESSRLEI